MNNEIPTKIKSYLQKRGEDKWLHWNPSRKYKMVVVIPSIKESSNISTLVKSLSRNDERVLQESLLLFVINNSDNSSIDIREDNSKTIELLNRLKLEHDEINIEFIDASSEGNELPEKYAGVGFARKIGMDQALLFFDYSSNHNAIVCLDADCEVDDNYLSEIQKSFKSNHGAAIIKYEHKLDNEAIINYEIFLRYYVLGLKFANSPFAYHSIGSCIAVTPLSYVKVGGMNKRKAGEDFYFLEKLAKISEIKQINSTTVYPSERESWRVPFGTGQRISRFYEKVKDEYVLYNPESFIILKEFISVYLSSNTTTEKILEKSKSISESLYQFLIENDFSESLQRIFENAKSDSQIYNQKNTWFDAFKTLKLIHYLRDNGLPEESMFSALNDIFDLVNAEKINKHVSASLPPVEKQVEYLNILRKLT